MTWLRCYENIDRDSIYDVLKNFDQYNGIVSISTTLETRRIKLTFNKFQGVDSETYNNLLNLIIAHFKLSGIVEDYKIDKLTV